MIRCTCTKIKAISCLLQWHSPNMAISLFLPSQKLNKRFCRNKYMHEISCWYFFPSDECWRCDQKLQHVMYCTMQSKALVFARNVPNKLTLDPAAVCKPKPVFLSNSGIYKSNSWPLCFFFKCDWLTFQLNIPPAQSQHRMRQKNATCNFCHQTFFHFHYSR